MLVGHARYRELMREGAFMLLPEWALLEANLPDRDGVDQGRGARPHARQLRGSGLSEHRPGSGAARSRSPTAPPTPGCLWRVERVTLDHLLAMLMDAQASATVCVSAKDLS